MTLTTLLLGVVCHSSSLPAYSRSRDIIGASKFKLGHVNLTTPLKGWFVILTLELDMADMAYMHAQFDHSSFSSSVSVKNLNGSRDLTTPLSGISLPFSHLWASTCYNQPTYQIWSIYVCPLRRYERRYKIAEMKWFGAVRGPSRSLEIASFDRAHKSSD